MKFSLFYLVFVLLTACGPRPEKVLADTRAEIPPQSVQAEQSAVWLATTNYTSGGSLARLDLKTGILQPNVLSTGPDAILFPDGVDGLFMLTRGRQDGVTRLTGPSAAVTAHYSLGDAVSPQGVARDSSGRAWVTSLDSNSVRIFTPDLGSEAGAVDLSFLREDNSPDGFAELAQLAPLGADHMAISAQRLRRSPTHWAPEARSGLAVVNTRTLEVEHSEFIDTPNPQVLFGSGQDLFIVGAGDLFGLSGLAARISQFSFATRALVTNTIYAHKVLTAHFTSMSEAPAVVAWYPSESKSCIEIGARKVICESAEAGYVFNKVLQYGNLLFVSYVALGNAQLWIVPIDGVGAVQKLNLSAPAESLSFGP